MELRHIIASRLHLLHRLRCPWSSDEAPPPALYRGAYAELVAASFLRAQGLRILRRNFCWGGRGELDIVARHGDILVACEVKSTISPASGAPARAINKKKRRHLRIGAYNWLRLLGYRVPVRLDIIEVYLQAREIPQLQWHQNAFPLDGKAQRDLFRSENPAPLSSEAGAGRVC